MTFPKLFSFFNYQHQARKYVTSFLSTHVNINKRRFRLTAQGRKEADYSEELFVSYLEKHSYKPNKNANECGVSNPLSSSNDKAIELDKEKRFLFNEAKLMTLSFYRTCIRCTKIMRCCNSHDEEQFKKREEEQRQSRIDASNISSIMSFQPPVDRQNELASRALYYLAFVKESFGQEVDCLTKNEIWREDDIIRFIYLMKQGEERRSWILTDYKFDDPYSHKWDTTLDQRLTLWEERATLYIRNIYKQNRWSLKSDIVSQNQESHEQNHKGLDDDDDFDVDWDEK